MPLGLTRLAATRRATGAGSAAADAAGTTYTATGLKVGSSAILYGNGTQIATATVDGTGKATWTLGSKPVGGTIITYDGVVVGSGGTVPASAQALGPTTASFTAGATSGSLITTITGLSSGETITSVSPNDGRVAISSGSALVVGLAASSTGTISYTLTTSLGRTLTVAVTATSAVTGPVLFLIMWGQSNSQALGTATTANGGFNASQVFPTGYSSGSSNPRFKVWGASNAFETYQPYVNSEQGDNVGNTWGSEAAVAQAWLADNPTGNVFGVWLKIGSTGIAPGSSARYWAPSGGAGQLYSILTNRITAAKAALSAQGITVNAANTIVIQSQGEQDARTSTDAGNYQTNLNTLIAQARTDWGASRWIIERLHVEMTLTGFTAGWSTVYAAQGAIVTADQNAELVSTDGLALGDGLHFTAAACDLKGIRVGATVQRWWTKAPFAGLTNIADPNNDRYARATTAGDLTTMKSCLPSDILAVATTGTTQRTYIDAGGVRRNNLAANVLRFDFTGGKRRLVHEAQAQNAILYCRDLTNPVWTAVGITPFKDQTGLDGVANSASRIVATANGGTILQSITITASNRVKSLDIKRLIGTGTIEATLDGTTYTAITGFDANGIARVPLPFQALAAGTYNVGFRIATSGDSFLIDVVQYEVGTFATSPIYTTGSATTRPAEKVTPAVLTDALQTAGVFVYRGRFAPATAATFIGGDGGNAIMGRTTLATRVMSMNGTVSLNADTTGTPYTGSFGVAVTFDATGRSLSINGSTLGTDTNVVRTTSAGVTIGAGSSTNALSQTGGTCDLVGWGPTLVAGAAVQALAAANP